MSYGTSRIDRRGLVKLAGWGMTGLRPPGRGNVYGPRSGAAAEQVAVMDGDLPVESAESLQKAKLASTVQAATAALSVRSGRVRYAGGAA